MKRKMSSIFLALIMGIMFLTSCGNSGTGSGDTTVQEEAANQMQYVTKEDLKADIDGGSNSYIILDVRKAADYDEKHIKDAFSGDVDSAISGTDDDTAAANLKAAISQATGSETGNSDSKYVLVCYSGKKYAQKSTDLMIDMGIAAGNIYTLEGGNTAWSEAGDEYVTLME